MKEVNSKLTDWMNEWNHIIKSITEIKVIATTTATIITEKIILEETNLQKQLILDKEYKKLEQQQKQLILDKE